MAGGAGGVRGLKQRRRKCGGGGGSGVAEKAAAVERGHFLKKFNGAEGKLRQISTDEQEAGRVAGVGGGGAVDAGWHGIAGVVGGDAPEIEMAEGVGVGAGGGGVVEVVAELVEPDFEIGVVGAAVEFEQFGAEGGVVDLAAGVGGAQTLAGRAGVSAKPSVGLDGGAVGVVGKNVGLDRAGFFVAWVAVNAVEDGIEVVVAEEAQIGEHVLGGDAATGAQGQGEQNGLIERGDRLAVAVAEEAHDLGKVTGQRALPAEGVDAVGERRGGEFVETMHLQHAGFARRHGRSRTSLPALR